MTQFYLWATVSSEAAVQSLVTNLLYEKITVASAATNSHPFLKGEVSQHAALLLSIPDDLVRPTNEINCAAKAMAIVKKALDARKLTWHGLVLVMVPSSPQIAWEGSNIKLPVDEKSGFERLLDDEKIDDR